MADVRMTVAAGSKVPVVIIGAAALALLAGRAESTALTAKANAAVAVLAPTADQAASPNYLTAAAGLASVADGAHSNVTGTGSSFANLYRKVGEAAVEQSRFTSKTALDLIASPNGSAGVGSKQSSIGAIDRNAEAKLRKQALHINDFGNGVGRGNATIDTDAFKRMFAEMQTTGRPGLIGGANEMTTLKLREGELQWTMVNAGSDRPGPVLLTQGDVVIEAAGVANAPIFRINNDPGLGFRYISKGYWGPMTFKDTNVTAAPLRHAFQMHGVEYMTFGVMTSTGGWKGDIFNIKPIGTLVTGDAWHVAFNHFEGVKAWNVDGWGINNDSNSQFFVFNTIDNLYKIRGKGGFRGPGALNKIGALSVSGTTGWAADLQPSDALGSTQGLIIEATELDGVQYGIRCNGVQLAQLGVVRVVHRYMEAAVAPVDVNSAWPIVVLQVGGPQGLATAETTGKLFNYYREGISPANPLLPAGHNIHDKLGTLVDFQNDLTTYGFDLDLSTAYNTAGVTLPTSKYFTGLNGNVQTGRMRVDGRTVINRVNRSAVIARAGAKIGNISTDFTLPLQFATMQLNQGNAYNTSTYAYTAQSDGLHHIRINVLLNAQDGDVVRLGIRVGGVLVRETRTQLARNDTQTFALEVTYPLARGDVVTFHGSSSVARAHQAGSIDIFSNNYIEVYQL